MGEVISFGQYVSERRFNDDVIPFFRQFHSRFHYYKEEVEAVFLVNAHHYLFIFLRYIPQNEPTQLPTLPQCFDGFSFSARTSTGEWVVDGVHQVEHDKAHHLLSDCASIQDSDVYAFLKKHVKK